MAQFSTPSPEQLLYSNAVLTIEVLGGIRIEGLDRMRVTLKISLNESDVPPVRHNLDLYNDTQLEKLIRKIAERLETGTSTIAGSMAELTQHLENYRLEKIQEQSQQTNTSIPLTTSQKTEAIQNLSTKDLLLTTISDLQASGIIGEAENALLLLLAMTSRKSQDPLSVVCLAKSGTGKSYLMDMVARCIPEEDKKEQTQFTGNAFYYFKKHEISGKVFIIKDLEGALTALFPIRELQSEKKISKTITRKGRDGKLETITLVVEGPVSVITCTTKESIYEDNANRSILLYLNDSPEQDEKIMQYQKNKRAGLTDPYAEAAVQQKLQYMQKALEPVKVLNPFAPLIDLPAHYPKKRRALPILLNVIEVITFYHQYQREPQADKTTGEMYIASTPEDVQHGFTYLKNVLFRRSDELSGAVRDFYEKLKALTTQKKLLKFKIADIRKDIGTAPRTVQHYLKQLMEYDYIHISSGKQRTGYEYELLQPTTQTQIEQGIEGHIKTVMEKIYKAHNKKAKKLM